MTHIINYTDDIVLIHQKHASLLVPKSNILAQREILYGTTPFGPLIERLLAHDGNGIIVIIGAGFGAICVALRALDPFRQVVAIESDPSLARLILDNLRLNGLPAVEVITTELASAVPSETLDDLFTKVDKIDAILIDLKQGADAVLRGANNMLASNDQPIVIVRDEAISFDTTPLEGTGFSTLKK